MTAEPLQKQLWKVFRHVERALSTVPGHRDAPGITRFVLCDDDDVKIAQHVITPVKSRGKYCFSDRHPYPERGIVSEGVTMDCIFDGVESRIEGPATIEIPPGCEHEMQATPESNGTFTCIRLVGQNTR